MKGCSLLWNPVSDQPEKLGELFKSTSIVRSAILSAEAFEEMEVKIASEEDTLTQKPMLLTFTKADFRECQPDFAEALFKYAVS